MKTFYSFALSALVSASAHATLTSIDFETLPDGTVISAPATFSATTPLGDEYSDYDVHFSSHYTTVIDGIANDYNGGSILTADSFGKAAPSGNNVLAFNTSETGSKETITFDNSIGYFKTNFALSANTSNYTYLHINAYNDQDTLIRSYSSYRGSSSYYDSRIGSVADPNNNISKIELYTDDKSLAFFYDDMEFGAYSDMPTPPPSSVPLPGSSILFGTALLGLIISRKCK